MSLTVTSEFMGQSSTISAREFTITGFLTPANKALTALTHYPAFAGIDKTKLPSDASQNPTLATANGVSYSVAIKQNSKNDAAGTMIITVSTIVGTTPSSIPPAEFTVTGFQTLGDLAVAKVTAADVNRLLHAVNTRLPLSTDVPGSTFLTLSKTINGVSVPVSITLAPDTIDAATGSIS